LALGQNRIWTGSKTSAAIWTRSKQIGSIQKCKGIKNEFLKNQRPMTNLTEKVFVTNRKSVRDKENVTNLSLSLSKPKKKFKMIFAQNDWVNNNFTKILGKNSSQ